MAERISITYKGEEYTGEYDVKDGALRVFYGGKITASPVRTSNPELDARLLLIELVSKA